VPETPGSRDRWFLPVLALGLSGAALGAVAAGQEWATASAQAPGPREVAAAGSEVAPLALPLALVALACWGAFLVLRTLGRRVVCALGTVSALGAVVTVLTTVGDAGAVAAELVSDASATTSTSAWPWVAAASLAVSAGAFVVAGVRCARWPQMSRRYDRAPTTDQDRAASPADGSSAGATDAPAEGRPADLWRALDDGRDPTL
jgi:uncharacterized membrane protein (TIGR02234 family)